MASRTKNGFRKVAASKNVYWHIAPGQGMKPPSGAFRRNHVFAQKRAEGINHGKTLAPHGERECARRRRQIAAGQLRAENGLEL